LHSGGAPGVTSVIVAALEDGIGIIALTNADAKEISLKNIIIKAAEKAFSSESAGMPSSLDLAGTYYNTGYGTLVLCNMRSTSPSCESVLDDFRAVDKSLSPNSTDLFASWNTVWSTHVRFTHTNASQYLISIGTIYSEGYGQNSTPFSTLAPATSAQFVVENERIVGFGFNETGDPDESDLTQAGSVEETSQVWFVKQA
jgi:hypothetical protein